MRMRPVDQMAHLDGCCAHLHVVGRHVLEEAQEVDLLLIVAAEPRPSLLADDRDHRRVVEPRVVEAVQKVDRAGSRGRHAHARPARELGMGAGHEGGDFLVRDLDEVEAVLGTAQGAEDAVDAVARIAVDALDAPFAETVQHEVADGRCHHLSPDVRALVHFRVAATIETSGAQFRCMKTSAGITAAVPLRQLTSMVLCHLPGDTIEGLWS